jgi:hypothetical protein
MSETRVHRLRPSQIFEELVRRHTTDASPDDLRRTMRWARLNPTKAAAIRLRVRREREQLSGRAM